MAGLRVALQLGVTLVLAAPATAFAQQSMWNVPSGTGTAKGGFFFQEQINASTSGESNLTAAVGVGAGIDLGINLFHVHLYGEDPPDSARNLLLAHAVFTVELADWLTLQFGGEAGFGTDLDLRRQVPAAFGWAELRFHPAGTRFAGVLGAWAATESYAGAGWPAGPMAGVEFELVREWLVLQGDLLMGNNAAAVGVIGAVLLLPLGWQLAVGLQVPSPFSHNDFGFVVEVTRVPHGTGDYAEPVNWQKDRVSPKWIREHRERHGTGDDEDDDGRELPPNKE